MKNEKMTSKRRAALRSEAQKLQPVVMVGHDGVTENVVNALNEALFCHELVKVKFQDFKEDTKELSIQLSQQTESDLVATTGFTAVFYKLNPDKNSFGV